MDSLFYAEWIVRLAMFVIIVIRKRSATTALAWLMVVAFLPFVGAVAYFMFGETRLGRRRTLAYQHWEDSLSRAPAVWKRLSTEWQAELEEPYRTLSDLAESVGATEARSGNALELIPDTMELFQRLCADIDAAEHHCHLLFYIANEDAVSVAVTEAMVRARKRGVACRVLLDAAGSRRFLRSGTCDRMRETGVEVVPMMPVNALRAAASRVDLRNHRKLVVIDGKVGYLGSHNLTTPMYPRKKRFGAWMDASVRVRGPVVYELQEVFLHDWAFNVGPLPPEDRFFPPTEVPEGNVVATVLPTGPGREEAPLLDVILQTLRIAHQRVVLTTPYFVPEDAVLAAMRSAALRGVEVVLVVPKRSDQALANAAGRSHYGYLLNVGVEIWQYQGALMHAKTLTMDREFAIIGSANLDVRSFSLNFELALLVYDTDFASEVHYQQMSYLEDSERLTMDSWRRRGAARILGDNVAKLITPLL
ncbi:MAG: cardiolipin synthase [Gemmatimonadota bacterium]|jgi:cardiolipin synthase A/B